MSNAAWILSVTDVPNGRAFGAEAFSTYAEACSRMREHAARAIEAAGGELHVKDYGQELVLSDDRGRAYRYEVIAPSLD